MFDCTRCQELQKAWEEAKPSPEIQELIKQVAQNHADEAEHVVVLMHTEVKKDDPSILNVASVILRPPLKFITISFTV